MRCRPAVATVVALLALDLSSAHADAVPPAPESCPPGKVGVTSHSGPACIPEAPDNCAPGYRGQVGGKCVLATCREDGQCEAGERCMQVDTCQEYRQLHWTGWGWSARRPVPAGNLIAGPPRPAPPGPPKKAWVQLHICGQDGVCSSPAKCRPAPLCYPTRQIGKTKAKVAEPGSASTSDPPGAVPSGRTADPPPDGPEAVPETDDTASDGDPPADADTVVDPTGYDPPRETDGGGCRKGCTTASTSPEDTFIGAGLWLLVAATVRRRWPRTP